MFYFFRELTIQANCTYNITTRLHYRVKKREYNENKDRKLKKGWGATSNLNHDSLFEEERQKWWSVGDYNISSLKF